MKKWIFGVAGLSLLLISNVVFADGESAKKKKSAFSLETPSGWVEDNSIALDFRLNAVYYPQNTSWNESSTVIYTNIEDIEGGQSVKDVIEKDLKNYQMGAPNLKVTPQSNIPISRGVKAIVKHIEGTSYGSYEAVAYVEVEDHVVVMVLSSRTAEDFAQSINAYEDLVRSFDYDESVASAE